MTGTILFSFSFFKLFSASMMPTILVNGVNLMNWTIAPKPLIDIILMKEIN